MQFEISTTDQGVVRVTLGGRLDLEATLKLEDPFTFQIATQRAPVVVDLSAVDFVASIGLRLLVKNAKAQQGRGGKLVLYKPTELVRETLTGSGIAAIIPVYDDLEEACQGALTGMTA
jgi:anti-sigma B factor antagonist